MSASVLRKTSTLGWSYTVKASSANWSFTLIGAERGIGLEYRHQLEAQVSVEHPRLGNAVAPLDGLVIRAAQQVPVMQACSSENVPGGAAANPTAGSS